MEIKVYEWAELDLGEIARVTYAAHHPEMRSSDDKAVAGIEQRLREQFAELPRYAVLARSGKRLAGWLMLVVQNPSKVEINPWFLGGHPLVVPGLDLKVVGARLLKEASDWAKEKSFETLEFTISQQPGESNKIGEYNTGYRGLGFGIREESVGMVCNPVMQDAIDLSIPAEVSLQHVLDVDQDKLYQCYYNTFQAGQSQFFFDQSEQERRAYFDTFGKTYGIHMDTSLALVQESRIVGFSYVIPFGNTHFHLDWMGIHPSVRRRGLGEFLLRLVMHKAAQQGVLTIGLNCDVGNTRAIALYYKLGWREEEWETKYALKVQERSTNRPRLTCEL